SRVFPRRGGVPRPPRPRWILRPLRQPQHSSAPYTDSTTARALPSRVEKAPPRRLHRETVDSLRTPLGCVRVRQPLPPLRFEGSPVSVWRLRRSAELPDPIEHVGGVNAQPHQLHTPDIDGSHTVGPVRELTIHFGQVAA